MSLNNLDDNDMNEFDEGFENDLPEVPPPAGAAAPASRTFTTAIAIIGGIFLIGVLALGGYFVFARGRANRAQAEAAQIAATNSAIAMAATSTQEAAVAQAATQKAIPTNTTAPTNTPVIIVATNTPAPTNTPLVYPGGDPAQRTATVAAFLTQAAQTTGTLRPTSTSLPQTGFADEVGIPGLFGAGIFLLVVVFVARRLRLSGE